MDNISFFVTLGITCLEWFFIQKRLQNRVYCTFKKNTSLRNTVSHINFYFDFKYYVILEDTAHHAGLLLALQSALTFNQCFFCPLGKKGPFYAVVCPFQAFLCSELTLVTPILISQHFLSLNRNLNFKKIYIYKKNIN